MSVSRFPQVFLCNFPRKATCKGKSKNETNKKKEENIKQALKDLTN